MGMLKKAWITDHGAGLAVLSLESAVVDREYARLRTDDRLMPAHPTPKHPLRHVVTVRLLDMDDLHALRDVLDDHITRHHEKTPPSSPVEQAEPPAR